MTHTRRYFFTKKDRILKRSEFLELSSSGKVLHTKRFIVIYSPGKTDRSRLGITVTKKFGNAVRRNRMKRIIRECFRLNKHRFKRFYDINIIAKYFADGVSFALTQQSLSLFFNSISDQ